MFPCLEIKKIRTFGYFNFFCEIYKSFPFTLEINPIFVIIQIYH